MKVKHLCIVGLGSIGKRHLMIAKKIDKSICITIVRSDKNKKDVEEKYADNVVYNLNDAIYLGIDTAIVSSPAVKHIEDTLYLFESGIHVLVEKPLSNCLDGIENLLKIQKKKKTVGMVGYVLRHSKSAKKFFKIVSEKKEKVIHVNVECSSYLPDWRKNTDYRKSFID